MEVTRHDSSLGRWTLARWTPPELVGMVDGIWCFDGGMHLPRERHFPLGTLDLIVHLGPVYGHVQGNRVDPFPRSCFTGLLLRPDVVEAPPGRSEVLGIRLLPPGAYALLGRPLHELTGHTVELADVLPNAAELEDRCEAAGSAAGRVRAASRWLVERLGPGPEPEVHRAFHRICEAEGAVPIRELRDRSGWHRTTFTARFREQVGVTPKRFARIQRFKKALNLVREGESLTHAALSCGYYDQAHLNREFRALSGFSPGDYRTRLRFPESASLPEARS